MPLTDLKEPNTVEVAEFTKTSVKYSDYSFCWWVTHVVRKRDVITSMVTSSMWKTTHKCGIDVPTDVEHSKRLGTNNANNFWIKVIDKEIHDVQVVFETLNEK